jgi:hypothetical protein
MPSTTIQQISTEDVKQAIMSLIKENNAEFKQLFTDLLPKTEKSSKKKAKTKQLISNEPIAHSEMPFWKSHPHLKPKTPEDFGAKPISIGTIQALQDLFQQPDCPSIEEWIESLD